MKAPGPIQFQGSVSWPVVRPMTNSSDRPGDEPSLSGEEWVEYGGELIWAVDFTSGGALIGLTSREFRRVNAELEHRAGWARAKALLASTFETCSSPVAEIDVGRIKKVGEGLFRKVYAAHVDLLPDPDNLGGAWAVLPIGRGYLPAVQRALGLCTAPSNSSIQFSTIEIPVTSDRSRDVT